MDFRVRYFLIIILLMVSLLSGVVWASDKTTALDVTDINGWEGSGTFDDPYILYTIEDIQAIGESEVNLSAFYELGCDIDASATKTWNDGAGFIPIGSGDVKGSFTGFFNGHEYYISNLYINAADCTNVGLFSTLEKGTYQLNVANIRLKNCHISATGEQINLGGIVGWNRGGRIPTGFVSGTISAKGNFVCAGGIVGKNDSSGMGFCYVTATVKASGENTYAGGIVGWDSGGSIGLCEVKGEIVSEGISASDSTIVFTGGIVGRSDDGYIHGCNVTATVKTSGDTVRIGGIAGWNNGGDIDKSNANGAITCEGKISDDSAFISSGGLVGENKGKIINSQTTNNISISVMDIQGSAYANCGGLVGDNQEAMITDCDASGNVSISTNATGENVYLSSGGLVGRTMNSIIAYCHSTGNINISVDETEECVYIHSGGLVGKNKEKTIADCYAKGNVTINIEDTKESAYLFSGGLLGDSIDTSLDYCYTSGNVLISIHDTKEAIYQSSGGLAGQSHNGTAKCCYTRGNVTLSTQRTGDSVFVQSGGLIGSKFYKSVSDCCSIGNVSVSIDDADDTVSLFAGGMIGKVIDGELLTCYSAGKVEHKIPDIKENDEVHTGVILGRNDRNNKEDSHDNIANCFWNLNSSCITESEYGKGLTTNTMLNQDEFIAADWNFFRTWSITPETTYPWLKGLDYSTIDYPAPVTIEQDTNTISTEVEKIKCNNEGELVTEIELRITPCEMVHIEAGTFQMGDPWGEGDANELPVHDVTLSAYEIGKYEITNREYAEILNWGNSKDYLEYAFDDRVKTYGVELLHIDLSSCQIKWSGSRFVVNARDGYSMADHQVLWVTWYVAAVFCNWLSESQGLTPCYNTDTWECDFTQNGYHLPTEAQWERAAAWDGSKHYRYGNSSDIICEYDENPLGLSDAHYTVPIWYYKDESSPAGCLNMTDKWPELCNDWWQREYISRPVTDPTGPPSGTYRMMRGRCTHKRLGFRTSVRGYISNIVYTKCGFRIARTL